MQCDAATRCECGCGLAESHLDWASSSMLNSWLVRSSVRVTMTLVSDTCSDVAVLIQCKKICFWLWNRQMLPSKLHVIPTAGQRTIASSPLQNHMYVPFRVYAVWIQLNAAIGMCSCICFVQSSRPVWYVDCTHGSETSLNAPLCSSDCSSSCWYQ